MRRWFHNNAEVIEKNMRAAKKNQRKNSIRWIGQEWEHCGLETSTCPTIKGAKPGKTGEEILTPLSVTEETGLPLHLRARELCTHVAMTVISMLLTALYIFKRYEDELYAEQLSSWQGVFRKLQLLQSHGWRWRIRWCRCMLCPMHVWVTFS